MKLEIGSPGYKLIENYLNNWVRLGDIANYVDWLFIDGVFSLYDLFTGEVYCDDIDEIVKYIEKSNVRHDRSFYAWAKRKEKTEEEYHGK